MILKAKKHRCPWCGEKTFSNFASFGNKYKILYTTSQQNVTIRSQKYSCPKCNKKSVVISHTLNKFFSSVQIILSSIGAVLFLGLLLLYVYESIAKGEPVYRIYQSSFAIPFLLIATLVFILLALIPTSHSYARYDDKRKEVIYPKVDLTIKTNEEGKKITPWGVYGLAIENAEADLHKIFDDGLIPAIFHPTSEGVLVYNVTLIGKDKLPENLINKNKLVKLEDKGNFFATGVINTVIEDQND